MDNSQQLLGFVCDVRFIHWNRYSDRSADRRCGCGLQIVTCSRTVRLASYELRIVSYMCVIIEIVSAARGLAGLNRGRLAGHESTVDLSTQAPIGACLPRRLPVLLPACLRVS